jgi:hypothetical protein
MPADQFAGSHRAQIPRGDWLLSRGRCLALGLGPSGLPGAVNALQKVLESSKGYSWPAIGLSRLGNQFLWLRAGGWEPF